MGNRIMSNLSTTYNVILHFNALFNVTSQRALTFGKKSLSGRNNRGVSTIKGRGGGHKRKYRILDFHRRNEVPARVFQIEYDPNRNAKIALLYREDGFKKYILSPRILKVGMQINSGSMALVDVGNAMPVGVIPLGSIIHNIELTLGKGGQIARASGTYAQILAKESNFVTIRLPSAEVRLIDKRCFATLGQVGNVDHVNMKLGKAGRSRWFGKKSKVRGVVKNPVDHPHGGGEGRSPIGLVKPLTPWGKPALGRKTRKSVKLSGKYILRRRGS
jgi:large subunit ribosomal protein L2